MKDLAEPERDNLRAPIYLAHSAISPPSAAVADAVSRCVADFAQRGAAAFGDWLAVKEATRSNIAALIGAEAGDVALTQGTTASIVAIAQSIAWKRGDRVITFEGEFPTNVTPWQQAAERYELDHVQLRTSDFAGDAQRGLDSLEAALRSGRPRLVAVSAVQFATGLAMPIAAMTRLAHAHGAEIFVDAIQAVGVMPFDVVELDVDYAAGGSHKWLMALEGVGWLYARRRCAEALHRTSAGWLSHDEPVSFLFGGPDDLRYDRPIVESIRFVEGGTMSTVGIAALHTSTSLLLERGIDAIWTHVQSYHDALAVGLHERGYTTLRDSVPARRSGIVSYRPPAPLTTPDVVAHLASHRVAVTGPIGVIRIAPHLSNGLHEVASVLAALPMQTGR